MLHMPRRSLTLLELLIAVVLLLAMAALILPSMLTSMEERTFESAADGTNEQLMMARAHAQATGSPVEVTYNADTSRVQARFFMPWLPDGGAAAAGMDGEGAMRTSSAEPHAAQPRAGDQPRASAAQDAVIGEPWATRELGRGVRIVSRPPESETDPADRERDPGHDARHEAYETLNELGKGQDVRLAVFMPDGSALLGDPVWLNDDKGRCGVLTINPWSGLPLFKRLGDEDRAEGDDEAARAASSSDGTGDDHSIEPPTPPLPQPPRGDRSKTAGSQ